MLSSVFIQLCILKRSNYEIMEKDIQQEDNTHRTCDHKIKCAR